MVMNIKGTKIRVTNPIYPKIGRMYRYMLVVYRYTFATAPFCVLQENHSFATDISVANPLQTYKNPLQISISNGFATEVFCCKKPCCNFAHFGIRLQKTNGFATELFRSYIATNFTSVSNSVSKSQKSKDNE